MMDFHTARTFVRIVWRTHKTRAFRKVEAAGTHEELVSQHGRYSNLFELQAAGYNAT